MGVIRHFVNTVHMLGIPRFYAVDCLFLYRFNRIVLHNVRGSIAKLNR